MAERRIHPEYRLDLVEHGDFLHIEVSGGVDEQAVRIAYWREIVSEGKSRGRRKLLVRDRKKGQPASPAELAELAILFHGEAGHFDRVAVIEPTPEFLPAIEYAEIFGQGLGINVRVFSAAVKPSAGCAMARPTIEPCPAVRPAPAPAAGARTGAGTASA